MALPVEIKFLVAAELHDARSLSDLLLLDSKLREYIKNNKIALDILKHSVCKKVVEVMQRGTREITTILPNGVKHGEYIVCTESGQLIATRNYVDGIMHGMHNTYFSNGNPQISRTYVNGNLDGKCTHYFQSGEIENIYYIKNDIEHNTCRVLDENGKLIHEENALAMC
jgi:antitoxin component YwqK of YwqJK toxin-antitoxin module